MKDYLKIMAYVKGYIFLAFLNVLFNILFAIFSLLSLLVFIPFLNLLFIPGKFSELTLKENANYIDQLNYDFSLKLNSLIVEEGPVQALVYLCIVVFFLYFLKNLCRYLAMFFLAGIRSGVVEELRNKLYHKIMRLPLSYFSDQRKGDLMSRVSNDVQEIEISVMSTLELVFREPFMIVLYLGAMFSQSVKLTVFSLILLPIGALIIGMISKSLKRTSHKSQSRLGELISNIEETLSGLRIIKAFTAEKKSQEKFEGSNRFYTKTIIRAYRKRDMASPLSEFLGSVVMVILIWFGGKIILEAQVSGDGFSGAEFVTYILIFSQILRPIQSIATATANINKGIASIERINVILDADETIADKDNAQEIKEFTQSISFKDVSFKYNKDYVLKNINLDIKKGKTIALVGQSGSGKSTLADLLPRFYDIEEGEVLIDGKKLKNLKIEDLRRLMGIVTQESILFNDTILNNIVFGSEGYTREDVIEAAKIANAHEFIEDLDNGYDTNIGDRGGKLSGGQRQRLSIARAVLKNPPILILDEATSALDTESEKLVQEALNNLMKNRTSLVIAHRLSTIKHADEIIVLQDGEIVERGKHNDLLENEGVYKKYHHIQNFE